MALEEEVKALRASIDTLIGVMKGGAKPATTTAAATTAPKNPPGRPKAAPKVTSKFKVDEIHTAAVMAKGALGTDEAKALITATGAADLNDLKTKPDLWDAFMASVDEATKPPDGSEEEGEAAEDDGL